MDTFDNLYKVEIDGKFYPATYCSVQGWSYCNLRTSHRKPVPDYIEIVCKWDHPSSQVSFLKQLDKELLTAKHRVGI